MVTRWAVLFVILITSGCASTSGGGLTSFGYSGKQEILVAYPYQRGWCFIRYEEGLPFDEICESGQDLRYSTNVGQSRRNRPDEISSHVLGLFEYMARNRNLN
ncbi:hypothetical protein PZ897_03225 [Hoeflea sp. YIM 152468]|uniref:hypothetical protein n=1 Tax=Hoeflea sp. YIM 152468 TaxID=3031759 RepID=UPI0023DCDF51|nr:hypothetical protein [Hoeflea sp. YIM 152468]MDF1607181.1 hypothetical protein [Hoeflea sp. YIM 152468]